MVDRRTIVAGLSRSILCCILGGFLILPPLHFGLLEQSFFLRQSLPLLTILNLILPNQSLWWTTKNTLVFTKLANPEIFDTRRVVKVGILLLDFSLACSQRIDTARGPFLLPASVGRFGNGPFMRLLLRLRRLLILLIGLCSHTWACLRALRGKASGIMCHRGKRRGGRAELRGIGALCLHCHALGGIRFTSEGKLGLGRRRGIGLLVEQADITKASWRRRDRGSVCDGSRNDTLV